MVDQENDISEVGAPDRWLLVGFIVLLLMAIGAAAFLYRPAPPDLICSKAEAGCADKSDPAAQ